MGGTMGNQPRWKGRLNKRLRVSQKLLIRVWRPSISNKHMIRYMFNNVIWCNALRISTPLQVGKLRSSLKVSKPLPTNQNTTTKVIFMASYDPIMMMQYFCNLSSWNKSMKIWGLTDVKWDFITDWPSPNKDLLVYSYQLKFTQNTKHKAYFSHVHGTLLWLDWKSIHNALE